MQSPPIPENDSQRVASLAKMRLLSTPREIDLDRITRTAKRFFGTEIALISLVDRERQWFKSRIGIDLPETPRDISFCGHALAAQEAFIVKNATEDERFIDNPLVTGGPNIRFYAGQPLTNSEGHRIGTICVISPQPREFSREDCQVLADLGRMVEIVLENRKLTETQAALLDSLSTATRDKLLDPLSGIWNRGGFDELMRCETARAARSGTPLALAMIDIDEFKKINDSFRHSHGDEAIRLAASLLIECARSTDAVARYGGEEFAIVAPDTPPSSLNALGGKVVEIFRQHGKLQTSTGTHAFTASVGLASAIPQDNACEFSRRLIAVADKALYTAKKAGRNRFIVAEHI